MRGKKILAAALALIFVVGSVSGCKDNTMDVLGMVGETPIYRWYYNAYLISQLEAYLSQTGVNLTAADKRNELKLYKQYRLNDLVGEFALREEARKQGFDKLTAEQEREVDLQYQEYYDNSMTGFMEEYGYDDDGRKKAEQAYMDLLSRSTLTPERLRQNFRDQYVLRLFVESVIKKESVSDKEIEDYYNTNLENEKKKCEEDATWFGRNTTDASIYIPEGYVDTVRITKKFNTAQAAKVNAAYAKFQLAQNEFITEILANGENSKTAPSLESIMNAAQKEVDDLIEASYVELAAELEAIREDVLNGADFIKTMELKSDDIRRISYFVSPQSDHVEEAYLNAALALENEGDISQVIRIEDGVCIIMLVEKLAPGVRTLDEVREAIRETLQNNRSLGLQLELMEDYATAADEAGIVTLYMDRL